MRTKHLITKVCTLIGVVLIVSAIGLFGFWKWNITSSVGKNQNYVSVLQKIIPKAQNAILEEKRDNTMATLSIDKIDFVGMIELPRFNSVLPVGASWGKVTKYPCKLSGSIYDGSIKIGGTTQVGQYDFYREISAGDKVTFTDVEGNCYTYEVIDLRYAKNADESSLNNKESSLTLFIKNVYDFEYLIVDCDAIK